jgi:mttA/Hcf106 family
MGPGRSADGRSLGIFEILLFLIIALIVIPPDDLPQVMRAVGKVMRELRLASNTVMREISGAIGDDAPFNILPPRFDDPHPPPMPPSLPSPAPPAFLAPDPQSQPQAESASAAAVDAPAPQASGASPASSESPDSPQSTAAPSAEHQASNEPAPEPASLAPRVSATRPRGTGELTPAEHQVQAEPETPPRSRRTRKPKQPSPRERSVPPADKP